MSQKKIVSKRVFVLLKKHCGESAFVLFLFVICILIKCGQIGSTLLSEYVDSKIQKEISQNNILIRTL